jgi:hypothetical protein
MQLENNSFIVVENIFSKEVLDLLEPYSTLLPSDKSSYDVWPSESTNNNTAPECFTSDVLGKDRLAIISELFNNNMLPCYNKTWLKQCDIAVQKIPVGGYIPAHTDFCLFSLTVFLSEVSGGEFCWWDKHNNKNIVEPKFNRGIIVSNQTYTRGLKHKVEPVKESTRFTLQLFVFDKNKSSLEKQGAIIEEEIND